MDKFKTVPPPGYRLFGSLFGDIDGPAWRWIVWGNLAALVPLAVVTLLLWLPYQVYLAFGAPLALPNPDWSTAFQWIVGIVIVALSMVVHEALHGAALRLLGYHPRLSYTGGFLYASITPGEFLTRRHYLLMTLTPLLTMTLVGGLILPFLPPLVGQAVLVALLLNGAASIGDLLVAGRASKQPASALFASDEEGIKVYVPVAPQPPKAEKHENPRLT